MRATIASALQHLRTPRASLRHVSWHLGSGSRAVQGRSFDGVLVVTYHGLRARGVDRRDLPFGSLHVDADRFEQHCEFFSKHCEVIDAQQWHRIATGGALPQRAVLLTFDDGYRTCLTQALPRLRAYNLPAIFFVCSGPIRAGTLHWYDALARAEGERAVASARQMSYSDWRQATADLDTSPQNDDPMALMSVPDLAVLARAPGMTIGCHTEWHPRLSSAPLNDQRREIRSCVDALREWTGQDIDMLAYPVGQTVDYDANTITAARDSGIRYAFTTVDGFAGARCRPFEQPRRTMVQGLSVPELAYRLSHAWQ